MISLGGSIAVCHAQWNMGKVKNILGGKKEPSQLENHIQQLESLEGTGRSVGTDAEFKTAKYIGDQFRSLFYKPYLGQYIHPFAIANRNNLSSDSYIKIFGQKLSLGTEVIIPPFSGTGKFNAQALPGMPEAENLWFVKFSDVGEDLNNNEGNGLEKIYNKAKDAISKGAEAVMFVNDVNLANDFTNGISIKKTALTKPTFILNHTAYKKYILQQGKGQDWINVDYDFSKTRRTKEGHNAVGYWKNQTPINVIVAARLDHLPGKADNVSGMAALLDLADRINQMRLGNYNYILVALSGTNDDRKGAESFIKKFRLNKENVNCMIHIDDIGALNSSNEIFLSGMGTAPDWEMVISGFESDFMVHGVASGEVGDGSHLSFYEKEIPVLNVFTKRANQDLKKLNKEGVARISLNLADMLMEIDNLSRFEFTKTKPLPQIGKMNLEVSMGIIPDYAHAGTGVLVGGVRKKSPAAFSNVQSGDIILKMEDYDIRDANDYARELAKYKKGDRIMIQVKRNEVNKKMLITFK